MRSATFAHLQAWRTRIWALILLTLAVVLAFVPLFDSLGFEWAFAMSVPASLAAADLGATFVRRQRPAHQLSVWRSFACAAAVALCLLVPPRLVISLNPVRVRQCDWSFGLLCFASLPA